MSHFSKKKTEVELFAIENFNYDNENPYTNRIEEEGEFIKIPPLKQKEAKDGNTISTSPKLSTKQ